MSEASVPKRYDLTELKQSFAELNLNLPFKDVEGDKTADEIYAMTQKIGEGVTAGLTWLADNQTRISNTDSRMLRRILLDEWAQKQAEVESYLATYLSHEVVYFRVAAFTAYFKYWFSQDYKTPEETKRLFDDLVARKLLVREDGGRIWIRHTEHYKLADSGLEPEDHQEIEDLVCSFRRKVLATENVRRQEAAKEMKKESTISLADLQQGKMGICFMQVPPEPYRGVEGKIFFRGGGALTVRATDGKIIPVDGAGAIEGSVRRMHTMDLALLRETLSREFPPGFMPVYNHLLKTRDIPETEATEAANLIKALWFYVNRAIKGLKAKEQMQGIKKEYRSRATISQVDFLGLNGSGLTNGLACLELEGSFKDGNRPAINEIFFLAERRREGNINAISIVDMPNHVAELLGPFSGKTFQEGRNFQGLPQILQEVLSAIHGQQDVIHEVSLA